MARFYFDVEDDRFSITDTDGEELADFEAARRHAIATAAAVARDTFPGRADGKVAVTVRTEDRTLFEATVRLQTTLHRS
jgi:uncharacterized protein DUF6894